MPHALEWAGPAELFNIDDANISQGFHTSNNRLLLLLMPSSPWRNSNGASYARVFCTQLYCCQGALYGLPKIIGSLTGSHIEQIFINKRLIMEAVGLVIGVIPLAVSALDTYRTILSSMKNAQRDLAFMSRDLRTEHQILQNTCEILLRGIATESELDLLLEDPFGPQWRRYDEQVRLRLWRSAYVFQERVDEMGQAALDLQQKLAIEKTAPGKVSIALPGPDSEVALSALAN